MRIQAVCEISIPSQSFVYSSSPTSLHQRRVQCNASHLPYRIWCAPPSYPLSENHIRFFLRIGRVCQRLSFFSPPEHHYMQQQPERQRTTRHGTSIGENPPRGSPCLLASLLTNVVSLCFFRKTGSGCAPSLNDLVPKAVLRHRLGQNDGR